MSDLVYVDVVGGVVVARVIPCDGNCLFAALAHQMFLHPVGSVEHRLATLRLRSDVVSFYRSSLEYWMEPLCAQALYTYGEEFAGSMSSVELVDYFLTDLSKPGVWGGEESLRAISQLHNYAIHVFRENSERSELNEGADDRLRIIHRLNVVGEYTHYDSVLSFHSGKNTLN